MKQKQIGLLLFAAIIAISFSAIFVKWSDAPPTVTSMYRMYFSSLLLIPFVWRKRHDFVRVSKSEWGFLALSGLCLGFHFALWFGSLDLTTVASSTMILALQPIIALLGGFIFYKERAGLRVILSVGLAIAGVMLIGWGDLGHGSRLAILGDILSFLSVIAVVGYLLIGQNKVKRISHWIYSFSVFLFAGLALNLFNLVKGVPMTGYERGEWGIFILLAIFPSLSHVIFNFLLSYVNTTTISMSVLGEPVGATILAAILLHEQVTLLQVFGGCIVLVGVFIFLSQQRRKAPLPDI
ncbi:DMT family transporter [Aciduricibacillus chroicocephali]|uniref:DMT family transporter n=1 Tax=Aciduricibacillus chroicocephali TaxID=3054939 RepID=A0ABY9KU86_9BACI|nr:DMT family transporter [Bacillaceae bacterium 44XB]